MGRVSLYVAMFLIWANLVSGAFATAGVCDSWGGCADMGSDRLADQASEDAETVRATQESGSQTMFSLFTSLLSSLLSAAKMATIGGPLMFLNLGLPQWLVGFIFGPMYVIVAADVVTMLGGRDAA